MPKAGLRSRSRSQVDQEIASPIKNLQSTRGSKRKSKAEIEKSICKSKLENLIKVETITLDSKFTFQEKKCILDAYYEKGFQIFQDAKLLNQYLPNRREGDLTGLVNRLKTSVFNQRHNLESGDDNNSRSESSQEDGQGASKAEEFHNLTSWQNLMRKLLGPFAQDKKIGLDEIYSEVLTNMISDDSTDHEGGSKLGQNNRNFDKIVGDFARLLQGKFPDRPTPNEAAISMRLFEEVNNLASSIDVTRLSSFADGTWLNDAQEARRLNHELALQGLDMIDGKTKKGPSINDVHDDRYLSALCLELPKVRRITDCLNPLIISESIADILLKEINGTSS